MSKANRAPMELAHSAKSTKGARALCRRELKRSVALWNSLPKSVSIIDWKEILK